MRIYLTGRLIIETCRVVLDESQLPARQGRIALAYLILRHRGVPRHELAEAVWSDEPPDAWDAGLSALLSRLRRLFRDLSIAIDVETLSGNVSLVLPHDTWVDVDCARTAIDEAQAFLRNGLPERPGLRHRWPTASPNADSLRARCCRGLSTNGAARAEHVEALECLADATLALNEPAAALRHARRCCELEPFRESAYERQMRAHLMLGNRAEALRTYDALRTLLASELGADPSTSVQAVYLQALRA